jgi:hypothetical protein
MKTALFLEKVTTMRLLFDPSWVDGCPGCPGPVFNDAIADYAIAGLLREISSKFKVKVIAESLMKLSKQMVESSSKGLIAGWEDGDDICPPWHPRPKKGNDPEPSPWFNRFGETNLETGAAELIKFSPAMESVMIAGGLKQLASLTTSAQFSKEIFSIGQQIVKSAAGVLFDEYCGTVPKPRPKPKYTDGVQGLTRSVQEMGELSENA